MPWVAVSTTFGWTKAGLSFVPSFPVACVATTFAFFLGIGCALRCLPTIFRTVSSFIAESDAAASNRRRAVRRGVRALDDDRLLAP